VKIPKKTITAPSPIFIKRDLLLYFEPIPLAILSIPTISRVIATIVIAVIPPIFGEIIMKIERIIAAAPIVI
jgi:hypothetical protein